jgi:hypothetical protein
MTDPLDRMLDALPTPEPRPGFADRIVARATALPQQPASAGAARRPGDRRGPWRRRHRVLGAFIGANLLAAGAVAAALATGVEIRQVPLIAPVIEAIAPKPRPAPSPPPVAARPAPAPAVDAPAAPAEALRPVAPAVERALARREALAAAVRAREAAGLPVPPRVRRRVEMHAKERLAVELHRRGEPVPIELRTDIVRERLELAPPRLRARVEAEVARRRDAGLPVPPALDAALAPAPPSPPPPPSGPSADPLPPAAAPMPEAGATAAPPPPPRPAGENQAAAGPAAPAAASPRAVRPRLDPARRQQLIEQIRARRAARAGPR